MCGRSIPMCLILRQCLPDFCAGLALGSRRQSEIIEFRMTHVAVAQDVPPNRIAQAVTRHADCERRVTGFTRSFQLFIGSFWLPPGQKDAPMTWTGHSPGRSKSGCASGKTL